jgi:hypothetical protein
MKFSSDIADPIREAALKERELPHARLSSTDRLSVKRIFSKILILLPTLMKLRTDNVEPKFINCMTDMSSANRTTLRRERLEPKCTKSRIDKF